MTVFLEPFASVYDDRNRLGVILAPVGAASRHMPPTITALDCFRARVGPLPRLPRRARGSPRRPPKTSPNGTNNDFPRLCLELGVGVGHGKADDKTQRTGPRDFVLRRDRH
jgi:hypothetical protein